MEIGACMNLECATIVIGTLFKTKSTLPWLTTQTRLAILSSQQRCSCLLSTWKAGMSLSPHLMNMTNANAMHMVQSSYSRQRRPPTLRLQSSTRPTPFQGCPLPARWQASMSRSALELVCVFKGGRQSRLGHALLRDVAAQVDLQGRHANR
eukprot:1153947-Pelagomonas_calceolata.AAC.1